MGVFEPNWIFQAIAKGAVHPNMRAPNERNQQRRLGARPRPDPSQRQWTYVGMSKIIKRGTDTRPCQIPQHHEVWHQQEGRKQHPRPTALAIEDTASQGDPGPLQMQGDPHCIEGGNKTV